MGLPVATSSTAFGAISFVMPWIMAQFERGMFPYTGGIPSPATVSPNAVDYLAEVAPLIYIEPLALTSWMRSDAVGKNPDELHDYFYLPDSPESITPGGCYDALSTLPERRRPAEFPSVAETWVWEATSTPEVTRPASIGMLARNLTDGMIYEYTSSGWVITDQATPPDLLSIPLTDPHKWFKFGDTITTSMFAAQKHIFGLMMRTIGEHAGIIEPSATWAYYPGDDGSFIGIDTYRNNFGADSRIANSWMQFSFGVDAPPSPGYIAASNAAYGVAQGLCSTAPWQTRPIFSGFAITGYCGGAIGVGDARSDGQAASNDPEENEEDFVDHSVTNEGPFELGDPIYRAAVGTARQLRAPEVMVYTHPGDDNPPDPRTDTTTAFIVTRTVELWMKGLVDGSNPYPASGAPAIGWTSLGSINGDTWTLTVGNAGPYVPPLPTPPLPTVFETSSTGQVGKYEGFVAIFKSGLTIWGFSYT